MWLTYKQDFILLVKVSIKSIRLIQQHVLQLDNYRQALATELVNIDENVEHF